MILFWDILHFQSGKCKILFPDNTRPKSGHRMSFRYFNKVVFKKSYVPILGSFRLAA